MHFYNFVGYCSMLTDENRLNAYVKALKTTITPDSVVLDLGAGTGIFSILACEFGAKKVYSVEVNPLISLLSDVIQKRGYEKNIQIIQKLSTEIELDEKANVLVSDIHGGFPLFESSIETIIDARERLLTDDAVMIPQKESIFFALSQSEEIYQKNVKAFLADFHGFRIPSGERLVFNRIISGIDENEKLLTKPELFGEIVYRDITEKGFSKEFSWEVVEDGVAHGLRGWFENTLSKDNGVSNSINADKKNTYARPFFPFEKEVEVKKGDIVTSTVSAIYEQGDYIWAWKTAFFDQSDKKKAKEEFNQSLMLASYVEPSFVLKQSEYFVPERNTDGEILLYALESINGEVMLGDIADDLLEKFPREFRNFEIALRFVSNLVQRNSN